MADMAKLVLAVDSSQARTATADLKALSTQASATEQSATGLGGAVVALGAAFAAAKVAQTVKEYSLLAARYETMGIVMETAGHNAGKTRAEMDGLETSLRKFGISAIESRTQLTAMAAANLDLAQSTQLARAAQNLAVVADLNSSEAFNKMITSIKSGLVVMLHHMGLQVSFEEAYKRHEKVINRRKELMSEQEKTQARVNAVLEAAARYEGIYEAAMGTAGKQIKSMERYTQDLQVALGSAFGPALTTVVLKMVDGFKAAEKALLDLSANGEWQVTQMKIKDGILGTIDAVVSMTKFLYDHAGAVKVTFGAYASFKIGQFVMSLAASTVAWYAEMRAQAAAAVGYLANNATKMAAIGINQRMAAAGVILSAEMSNEAIIARDLAAAHVMANTAKVGAAGAASGAATALSALGGPITILIGLLGAAAIAWMTFKDKTRDEAKDAAKNIREQTDAKAEQIKKQKEFWEALKNTGDVQKANAAMWSVEDDPAVKQLDKKFGELQSKLQELRKPGLIAQGAAKVGLSPSHSASKEELDIEKELKQMVQGREQYIEQAKIAHKGALDIEAKQLELAKLRTKETKEAAEQDSYYLKHKADFTLKIAEQELRMANLSKEEAANRKAAAEYEKTIQDINTEAGKKDSKLTGQDAAKLKAQAAALRDVTIEANNYAAATERLNKALQEDRAEVEADGAAFLSLRDELMPVEAEARKFAEALRVLDVAAEGAGDKQLRLINIMRQRLTDAQNPVSKMFDPKAMNDEQVTRSWENQLAYLNKLKEEGRLLPGAYRDAWVKIMRSGETAFSYLANFGETFANRIGEAFGNLVTGVKTSFKDLVSSILAEAARAAASRAFQQLFMMALQMMGPSAAPAGGGMSAQGWSGGMDTFPGYGAGVSGGGSSTGTMGIFGGTGGAQGIAPGGGRSGQSGQPGGSAGVNVDIKVEINQTSDGGTSAKSSVNTQGEGANIGRMLGTMVSQKLQEEMRPGGMIYQFARG